MLKNQLGFILKLLIIIVVIENMIQNHTIISDPGIDDLVALLLLYKLKPEAKNVLVSTFGNAAEKITSKNAKEFISFVSTKWQFMHGASSPLNNKLEHPWPDYFHGQDGVWGVHPKVDISKIHYLTEYPKNKNVISLAALTDLYKMKKTNKFKNVTIMGGAFAVEGNETWYAETNIAFDTDSAHLFFKHCSNVNANIVPLDVTRKVFWDLNKVNKIPEINKVNIWIKKLLLTWFDKYDHDKEKDFNLHDPLAVYLTWFPEEAIWITGGVEVITKGEKRGQTIFQSRNPHCKIAMNLKNPLKIADSIFEKIFVL